ncbi:MAG: phage major capsid protein [Elusimicrobiales bacterium]
MNEYDEAVKSISELRKTLETRLDDCITRENAEKIAEDAVRRLHPPEKKALLPQTPEDLAARAEKFRTGAANAPEKPWTSAYGAKFGNMRNFLIAAREHYGMSADGKAAPLAEGGGTGGGYLVPAEFTAEVVRIMGDVSVIMQLANVIPMSGWKRHLPKQLTNVAVGWVAEGAARPVTNPTFGQIEQVAKVLAAVIKCSDELLRDSAVNLTAFLAEIVAENMALEIERVALAGSVSGGDPFDGVLNGSGVNQVSMAGASVCFDDIASLLFSLNAQYARDGVIALSRTGLKKLLALKDTTGSYIWQPPAGNLPATLWNTPYVVSSQIPTNLGTGSDLTAALFGRFKNYLIVSPRQQLEVRVSQDAADWVDSQLQSAFMSDQTWLRFSQALSVDVAYGAAFSCLKFK